MPAPRPRPSPARDRRPSRGGAGEPSPASPAPARVGPRANALHSPEYHTMLAALRAAREAAGLTLEDVATRLKRPVSYVWKCEHGERRVDAIELWRFASLYGRFVGDFVPPRPFRPDT